MIEPLPEPPEDRPPRISGPLPPLEDVLPAEPSWWQRLKMWWQGNRYGPLGQADTSVLPLGGSRVQPPQVPGGGYQPIGYVDLSRVKPPQRPSAIAPQRSEEALEARCDALYQELCAVLQELDGGENPPYDPLITTVITWSRRKELEQAIASFEAQLAVAKQRLGRQANDLPHFPQGVTLLGKPDVGQRKEDH